MKIPEDFYLSDKRSDQIIEMWHTTAFQISMRTGVYINVVTEYNIQRRLIRIYFEALDREIENLNDLERLLKLKAFA